MYMSCRIRPAPGLLRVGRTASAPSETIGLFDSGRTLLMKVRRQLELVGDVQQFAFGEIVANQLQPHRFSIHLAAGDGQAG
ncbi:hypothetical protein EDC38_1412 [Marinimicrobium koreense]|uniref:Uncharacterized protein n=1 Tax=Marinimicrobium koreense TaxID=306545 RepID=A0A3N1NX56_9GAMM|nr:hypothetical protein EDC38_1412 [Marinimicrobium koreense]